MTVDIKLFEMLNEIATKHKVQVKDWAKAADLPGTRISELRGLLRKPEKKIGRTFSAGKATALIHGLREIMGGTMFEAEVIARLDKATTQQERLMVMFAALANTEKADALEMFMKTLLELKKKK